MDPALIAAHTRFAGAIHHWSAFGGRAVDVPLSVLDERIDLLGLAAPGPASANGSCRMIACGDAWLAVNLPRDSDHDLVPALLESHAVPDSWRQIETALRDQPADRVLERARLLGLAIARVDEDIRPYEAPIPPDPGREWCRRPEVIDLSALWAGPLCGAILAEAGCAVTKIETSTRPDTTAARSATLDDRLNGAKQRRVIDLDNARDRAALHDLIASADVILTSARRRGLESLGIARLLADTSATWIEITAHADSDRIGFGDDCAAAAGLVEWRRGTPHFVGDAVADPLTGLAAAAAALEAIATRCHGHRNLALSAVARAARHDG